MSLDPKVKAGKALKVTNPDVKELRRYNRELWCGHVRAHLNPDGNCARCEENEDYERRLESLNKKIDWQELGFRVSE